MNKFEVVLIFNPELSTTNLKSEIENFKTKLVSQAANIINEEDWGLRDLSYNINKFKKAFYNFFQIEASGGMIKDLNILEKRLIEVIFTTKLMYNILS